MGGKGWDVKGLQRAPTPRREARDPTSRAPEAGSAGGLPPTLTGPSGAPARGFLSSGGGQGRPLPTAQASRVGAEGQRGKKPRVAARMTAPWSCSRWWWQRRFPWGRGILKFSPSEISRNLQAQLWCKVKEPKGFLRGGSNSGSDSRSSVLRSLPLHIPQCGSSRPHLKVQRAGGRDQTVELQSYSLAVRPRTGPSLSDLGL